MHCKHCEKECDDAEQLKTHVINDHHTESKTLLYCDWCDKPYSKYSYRVNDDYNCCSRECTDKYKGKDGLDTVCEECSEEIHIPPSHIDEVDGYSQDNYFCSKDCESEYKSREWRGSDHPSWDGGDVTVECEQCGDEYGVIPSKVEKTLCCSTECLFKYKEKSETRECVVCDTEITRIPSNFKKENACCSDECFKSHISELRKGEDNPQWKGGQFNYYGPNWNEQREKALERDDNECQECGMSMGDHIRHYSEQLHVHHKKPRREFVDIDDPSVEELRKSNKLSNLVTLCKSCHRKMESS